MSVVLLKTSDQVGLVTRLGQRALVEKLLELGDLHAVVVRHCGLVVGGAVCTCLAAKKYFRR